MSKYVASYWCNCKSHSFTMCNFILTRKKMKLYLTQRSSVELHFQGRAIISSRMPLWELDLSFSETYHLIFHSVGNRWCLLSNLVMGDTVDTQDAFLLEHPAWQSLSKGLVARLAKSEMNLVHENEWVRTDWWCYQDLQERVKAQSVSLRIFFYLS